MRICNERRAAAFLPDVFFEGCEPLTIFRLAAVALSFMLLTAAKLPQTVPLPAAGSPAAEVPLPEPRPQAAAPTPVPSPAPRAEEKTEPAAHAAGKDEMQGPPAPALTIASESEEDHAACEKELQAMGASFKDVPRIDDGNGCGIDKPIVLSQALPGIRVKPEGTMRCQTALALARWMQDMVIPAGHAALAKAGPITTVNQASTYICRLRNNAATGKISEHARGNAIDVASFTFEDGTTVAVEPRREDPTLTGAFQRAVSAAGCLYFTTVLDPESDAAHENHFHLDVMKRNGGYRYCH